MITLESLKQLQHEQYKHDQKFHADILCLPVQRRMTHMTLHNAKYVGAAIQAKAQNNTTTLGPIIVDTFIIALASANTLNIALWDAIKLSAPMEKSQRNIADDGFTMFIDNVGISAGRMAKAVESLDHLEAFPYRETLSEEVMRITNIVLHISDQQDIDLPPAVRRRWGSVEEKSFLCEADHSSTDGTATHQYRIA